MGRYVCDFVCIEACVSVELDGSQHIIDAPYDANRDAFLRSIGFRVLRFWNGDVVAQTDSVFETIFEALHRPEMDGASTEAFPLPYPPPYDGGGAKNESQNGRSPLIVTRWPCRTCGW